MLQGLPRDATRDNQRVCEAGDDILLVHEPVSQSLYFPTSNSKDHIDMRELWRHRHSFPITMHPGDHALLLAGGISRMPPWFGYRHSECSYQFLG